MGLNLNSIRKPQGAAESEPSRSTVYRVEDTPFQRVPTVPMLLIRLQHQSGNEQGAAQNLVLQLPMEAQLVSLTETHPFALAPHTFRDQPLRRRSDTICELGSYDDQHFGAGPGRLN